MDITMCKGTNCPLKDICHRHTATPNKHRQSYFAEVPYSKNGCDHFELDSDIRVACDVDGVCLNFVDKFKSIFPEIDYDFKSWYQPNNKFAIAFEKIKNDPSFWSNLDNLFDPVFFDFRIDTYLTAIDSSMVYFRELNLIRNGHQPAYVIASNDKVKACEKLKLNILIDDKPSTVRKAINKGLKVIQFYPPYAKWEKVEGVPIVYHPSQIKFEIAKLWKKE